MSKMDWERKGPPRPRSGGIDRPSGIGRSDERVIEDASGTENAGLTKVERRQQQIAESEAHDMDLMLATSLRRALAKRDRGEKLGFFEQVIIERGEKRGLF